jgi:hypothetical protein
VTTGVDELDTIDGALVVRSPELVSDGNDITGGDDELSVNEI